MNIYLTVTDENGKILHDDIGVFSITTSITLGQTLRFCYKDTRNINHEIVFKVVGREDFFWETYGPDCYNDDSRVTHQQSSITLVVVLKKKSQIKKALPRFVKQIQERSEQIYNSGLGGIVLSRE